MNSSRSSSSSSTESTSSTSSSSCTESGSTSTDSESSSLSDAKISNSSSKGDGEREGNQKLSTPVVVRKSAERRLSQQKSMVEAAKLSTGNSGPGTVTAKGKQQAGENPSHRLSKSNTTISSEDDAISSKKVKSTAAIANPIVNATPSNLKRKNPNQGFVMASSRLQKVVDVISERNISTADNSSKPNTLFDENNAEKKHISSSPITDKAHSITSKQCPAAKSEVKNSSHQDNIKPDKDSTRNSNTNVNNAHTLHSADNKGAIKRNSGGQTASNNCNNSKRKYADNYNENTGTDGSGDGSSSVSTDSESDSDSSYSTRGGRGKRCKRTIKPSQGRKPPNSDTEDGLQINLANRKLTRSLSTRCNKMSSKLSTGVKRVTGSDSDTDMAIDKDTKHTFSKSSAKKTYTGVTSNSNKSKAKKESCHTNVARAMSPLPTEKKCAIEGCDSSGHLSGHLDRHFLPEACPIYHNMSVSECKERAIERKLRKEKATNSGSMQNSINSEDANIRTTTLICSRTNAQKEFYLKIVQSRNNFTQLNETSKADKVKVEKDCTDEDREPNLNGLVPDYDLQLFREAQALASAKIEDDVKDLPIGKGIKYITMGKYRMKVWYQSPYPEDVARLPQMYICEFCLRYQKSEIGIKRHAQKCVWRHPPGDEIYRKGKLQVWQVDGKKHKQYCQHLCLLAKFFLDHKTLYYDVEPFLFYIMTLADVDGCHTVGYFSKEKNSFYNVSCILTLPPYQRKGYGRLLIDFSYLLTRVEGKIGSPEKPLSDLGLISYRSYWKDVLLDYLCNRSGNTLSIKDVSQEMAIYSYDIVSTLQALGMMKYWKGKHIVLKKQDVLDEYEERISRRGTFPKIDESCLRWMPFVPTQPSDSS